jgi:hypothetical protein
MAAAGVSVSPRLQSASFIHDSMGPGADNSVVIVNPNAQTIEVVMALAEAGGEQRATTSRAIPPNGYLAAAVTDLFHGVPAIDETTAVVRLSSNDHFAAAAMHFAGSVFSQLPLASGPVERYGFEDTVHGWTPGTFERSRAIRGCTISELMPYAGRFSLRCELDLDCRSADRASGEVEVDLRSNPPGPAITAPADIAGVRITARVRAPEQAAGATDARNGWQLYVKDLSFRGFSGSYTNIQSGNWSQIEATPSRVKPRDGFIDEGFDPTQAIVIGVRLGCGDRSATVFRGDVFIDAVSW